MKPKVTYAEISRVSGVSEATVSRVLNGDPRVNPERVQKVRKAVEQLGYTKNRSAAALASGRTGLIAIVIEDDLSVFSDPFWATVTPSISRVLMENELHSILLVSEASKVTGPLTRYLKSGEVDGAIFFQLHRDGLVKTLAKDGLPVVVVGAPHKENKLTFVDVDQRGGGKKATQQLFISGCSRVATITGDIGTTAGHLRLDGYMDANKEVGVEPEKNYIQYGDYSMESGALAMKKLLNLKNPPDGVFCANDLMAVGAIATIEAHGLRCPEDIKIVGFDDSLIARTSKPTLTSIRQDIAGLGENAAKLMLNLLNGESVEPIILPTQIVKRASC